MRRLKSGEIKFKPSALKEVERLSGKPIPLRTYPMGTRLQVYMGGGWQTGYVTYSSTTQCSLMLAKEQRSVTCSDNRNLRTPVEK
jgi:hypothetical protein